MMGTTHALIGMTIGAAMATHPQDALIYMAVGGISALLPDVDHPRSILSTWLHLPLPHRGPTHSIIALSLWAWGCISLLPIVIALVAVLAFASHIVADMLTRAGIRLLWPLKTNYRLLPKGIAMRTDGLMEHLIILVGILVLLMLWGQMLMIGGS